MKRPLVLNSLLILVLILSQFPQSASAAPMAADPPPADSTGSPRSKSGPEDELRTLHHDKTGLVRFIGAPLGAPLQSADPALRSASTDQAARAFAGDYGPLFGLTGASRELGLIRSTSGNANRSGARYQQQFNGIPVFGGELIVQLDGNKQLLSMSGEILPNINISTKASIASAQALQKALALVAGEYDLALSSLNPSLPELWIYNPMLIGNSGTATSLVWRIEITTVEAAPINQLVLINASDASVELNFNQVPDALNRKTYTYNNTTNSRSLVCNEADPNCAAAAGDQHAINAHKFTGDTYNFYSTYHGRDSIDDAGMTLKSNVHYDSNYCNAFWNGSEMFYGDGCNLTVDDVVAHEITHGVTDYTSDLVYQNQSGAMNESFSDIWGEFVDQTNGSNVVAGKWKMGEDSSIGAIRNMKNPPSMGDPDRMGSPNYYNGPNDNGGVHTNSGVGNKTAYLITDGATFNGFTITGLGITKTAKIFYEVQSNLLTSGSNYADLGAALFQACLNLIGSSGISSADCGEVLKATYATEIASASPTTKKPRGSTSDRTPTFKWTKIAGASSYQFQVWKGSSKLYTFTVGSSACGASTCSKTPGSGYTLVLANHKWRVRSKVAGSWGPWSAYRNFTVTPPVPVTKEPKGFIADRTPTFKWTTVPGGTAYEFQVRRGTNLKYSITMNSSLCGSKLCVKTPTTLLYYATHKWRVRVRANGLWGPWSPYRSFTVSSSGFDSQFSTNADGWAKIAGKWSIGSGKYKSPGIKQHYSSIAHSMKYSLLSYQVRMKRTGGNLLNGIWFRGNPKPLSGLNDWDDGFYFGYYNDGKFIIGSQKNGSWTTYLLTSSSAINKKGWNTLKVTANGDFIQFFINGKKLAHGILTAHSNGNVGADFYRASAKGTLLIDWAKLNVSAPSSIKLDEGINLNDVEFGPESPGRPARSGRSPASNNALPSKAEKTATATHTAMPTKAKTASATATQKPSKANTFTPTPSAEPSLTHTATASPSAAPSATVSPTPTPTQLDSATPTATPEPTQVDTASPTPSEQPTATNTQTPTD